MVKVSGWDTDGVTGLGALADGRMRLELVGKDGIKRNVFIPGDSLPALVASLVGFSANLAKKTGAPDQIAGKHMMGVKSFTVGSDETGAEFAFALITQDNLELQFELLPVPRTLGLGVMMGLEVADGTTQFQPGVQARGGAIGARAWGIGGAGGA